MKKFPILKNHRIKLVHLEEKHISDLFEVYSDEESMKYYDIYPHKSLEETKKLLEVYIKRFYGGVGLRWGITLIDDEKIIGTIGINRYVKNRIGFLGADLNRNYWNKGIASDALSLVTAFGFNELGVHRLEAHVLVGNVGSEKVLQKNGYLKEGVHRDREYYKDKHQTIIMYAKLSYEL